MAPPAMLSATTMTSIWVEKRSLFPIRDTEPNRAAADHRDSQHHRARGGAQHAQRHILKKGRYLFGADPIRQGNRWGHKQPERRTEKTKRRRAETGSNDSGTLRSLHSV